MRTEVRPSCYLCGTDGAVRIADARDRVAEVPGTWIIRHCSACDLAWLDPQPIADDVHLLYGSAYYTHENNAVRESPWLRRALHESVRHRALSYPPTQQTLPSRTAGLLLSLIKPLKEMALLEVMNLPAQRTGRLLDVGCGAGQFLARMRDLGWSVAGLEPDANAARLAIERHRLDVRVRDLTNTGFEPGSFDAITLHHVSEHLTDPIRALTAARSLLRPDGWIVIATPNIRSLGCRIFGSSWLNWDAPRHLHLFSPDSLRAAVERAGFDVVAITTPTRQSRWSYGASRRIRRRGSFPSASAAVLGRAEKIGGIAFHLIEACMPARSQSGEEIFLIATPRH